MNESDKNRAEVIANDNDIKRQTPLIKSGLDRYSFKGEIHNEEIFRRAIAR
jgi:hypothetical protein